MIYVSCCVSDWSRTKSGFIRENTTSNAFCKSCFNTNTCKTSGGGIFLYMNGNKVTMESGLIAGNTAGDGGGVVAQREVTFIMNGGEIAGGQVTGKGRNGGNVFVTSKATFEFNGGSINWGKGNKPMLSDDYPYLYPTYIDEATIKSPTIVANEFNVVPSDEDDYAGSFNIHGMQLGKVFHMMALEYQGYNGAQTPYINLASPGGATLRFNDGGYNSEMEFYEGSGYKFMYTEGGDLVIDVGAVKARFDSNNFRITFYFQFDPSGETVKKTWILDANGLH